MKNKMVLLFLICFVFVACKQQSKEVLTNNSTVINTSIITSLYTKASVTNVAVLINNNQQKIAVKPAKESLTKRLLKWFFISLFIAVLPVIIGIGGGYLSTLITGKPFTNEGNCPWAGFIWLIMFSIPIGIILFVVMAIVCLID